MTEPWLRHNTGFLSRTEQQLLVWLAARLPSWATPDMMTAVGFLGAIVTCAAYAMSSCHLAWLWCASVGLAVNWFGDSLDGTLARYRRIERPRYGFFLDNALDIVAQVLFAIGIALSGLIRLDLALIALVAFLMLSMLSLLRANATNDFQMAYAKFGLTELRLAFVLLNALMFFIPPRPLFVSGIAWSYPNLLSIAWSVTMFVVFAISALRDIRRLAVLDPPRGVQDRER